MKIIGVRVEVEQRCSDCGGKGKCEYPCYHNDYRMETCHTCNGGKVIRKQKTLPLSKLLAAMKEAA